MITLSWVELLILASYFEEGIGFTGANLNVIIELEYSTRGSNIPFILGIDANIPPEEWSAFPWGDQNFLGSRTRVGKQLADHLHRRPKRRWGGVASTTLS